MTATTQESTQASIRWMIRRDLPEVLAIEKASFSEPWHEANFLSCLRERNTIGMVAEREEKVVGFWVYELQKDHIRLLNMAVHPDCRRRGIGLQIIEKLKSRLSPERRSRLIALVPKSCADAKSFFDHLDVETRAVTKKGTWEIEIEIRAMTKADVREAQEIEDETMSLYQLEPRDIALVIANDVGYGLTARDKIGGQMAGFLLYQREASRLNLDGQRGVVVACQFRREGVGRALTKALTKENLPIIVYDISLHCTIQRAFLKAVGVPIPEKITVEWRPEQE